jgi:DNA-binding NarL/FixJ family response regulator
MRVRSSMAETVVRPQVDDLRDDLGRGFVRAVRRPLRPVAEACQAHSFILAQPGVEDGLSDLTPRELQVLRLLAAG